MAETVQILGVEATQRDLRALAREVEDLDEFTALGRDIAAEASSTVAVVDGALRASIRPISTANRAAVEATTDYARINNARSGFLTTPGNDEPSHVDRIERALDNLIRRYHF